MSTYPLRKKLADIATSQVGFLEHGTNTGAKVIQYQRATDLRGTGWPWCAAFVCWCVQKWASDPAVWEEIQRQLRPTLTPDRWRPQTASAFGFEAWARSRRCKVLPRKADLKTGDLMIFSMSHIGIVADDDSTGKIYTVEGNTGATGGRDGDGVWAKVRRRSEARSFIRILE